MHRTPNRNFMQHMRRLRSRTPPHSASEELPDVPWWDLSSPGGAAAMRAYLNQGARSRSRSPSIQSRDYGDYDGVMSLMSLEDNNEREMTPMSERSSPSIFTIDARTAPPNFNLGDDYKEIDHDDDMMSVQAVLGERSASPSSMSASIYQNMPALSPGIDAELSDTSSPIIQTIDELISAASSPTIQTIGGPASPSSTSASIYQNMPALSPGTDEELSDASSPTIQDIGDELSVASSPTIQTIGDEPSSASSPTIASIYEDEVEVPFMSLFKI